MERIGDDGDVGVEWTVLTDRYGWTRTRTRTRCGRCARPVTGEIVVRDGVAYCGRYCADGLPGLYLG